MSNNFHKHKYTIVDSELRDLFAGFVVTGIVTSYSDSVTLEEDKDDIARVAYSISDAMIRRRKINKQQLSKIDPVD